MFDISFSELMIIGVVALLVIGPERLPKVARTLGLLLGRAQRYVNDVKTDIKREMDAGEFNNLKNQFDEAAGSVKASLENASNTLRNPLEEAQQALRDTGQSLESSIKGADTESKAASEEQLASDTTATPKGVPAKDAATPSDANAPESDVGQAKKPTSATGESPPANAFPEEHSNWPSSTEHWAPDYADAQHDEPGTQGPAAKPEAPANPEGSAETPSKKPSASQDGKA
jgi:sec-independent protein translocase protein TatB